MKTTTHHDREWADLVARHTPGTTTLDQLALSSRYATVVITREHRESGETRFRLAGGRTDGPKTWRATIRGCGCGQPVCKSAGKVSGYREPGWTFGTAIGARGLGRNHPESCHGAGYCHGGSDVFGEWVPADVVALAQRALETWAPRKPSRPQRLTIRYDPKHIPAKVDEELKLSGLVVSEEDARLRVKRADAIRSAGAVVQAYIENPPSGWKATRYGDKRVLYAHLDRCPAILFPDGPTAVFGVEVPTRFEQTRLHQWIDAALRGEQRQWCPTCLSAEALNGNPAAVPDRRPMLTATQHQQLGRTRRDALGGGLVLEYSTTSAEHPKPVRAHLPDCDQVPTLIERRVDETAWFELASSEQRYWYADNAWFVGRTLWCPTCLGILPMLGLDAVEASA